MQPSQSDSPWRLYDADECTGKGGYPPEWHETGKVRMERVWPWEHSEWFQPYVAGYYAWVYLAEEVTREQAEARLDELLALERSVA